MMTIGAASTCCPRYRGPGTFVSRRSDLPLHSFSRTYFSATVLADTYLCTYFGAPVEGLRNEAKRRVDVPDLYG